MAESFKELLLNFEFVIITVIFATIFLVVFVYFYIFQQPNVRNEKCKFEAEEADSKHIIEQKESPRTSKKKKKVVEKWRETKFRYSHQWLLTTLKGHSSNVLGLDFNSNGKYMASCSNDRTVLLWSVKTFNQKDNRSVRVNIEYDYASEVKWSPDSKAFIICQATGNTIQVYKVGKKEDGFPGNVEPLLTFPTRHNAEIKNIGIACNGRFILSCSSDTTMIIWNLKGEVLASVDTLHVSNYYGCVSPCGRFIASSGFTPDVKVWEVCFGKEGSFKEVKRVFELKGHSSGVLYFAFSNDSSRMASVSKDGTWKLWDTNIEYQKGQEPYLLMSGCYSSVGHSLLALSPDGRTIAIASSTNITVFSAVTGEEQAKLEEVHAESISVLQFSPSGQFLLCGGGKHIHVFHNVPGYKNIILDLEQKRKKASAQNIKDRLQVQIDEARVYLQNLGSVKE